MTMMHADELSVDEPLVRALLRDQCPQWAGLPLTRSASTGTDNAIFRLGEDLAVRLPRVGWASEQPEFEAKWLTQLAPRLPVPVPVPLVVGRAAAGYPWRWSVYRWLPGDNPTPATTTRALAHELAEFLAALQRVELPDPPLADRGRPLALRDDGTRQAIAALAGMIDTDASLRVWEAALAAGTWSEKPVWVHGDLLPGNLVTREGRLRAVIDFSGMGVGDPACDLMIAWALMPRESREAFRAALGVDDATWARGRGLALSQAVIFIPYYLNTNPIGVAAARHTLAQVLA